MLKKHITCVAGAVVLVVVCGSCLSEASADLAAHFTGMGFESIFEQNVSGLRSSYHAYTEGSPGVNNIPNEMFTLSNQRMSYPWIGAVPSPGGPTGRLFDEGAMGLKIEDGNIVVKVAGRLNPLAGIKLRRTWYGQGDVFLTVEDSAGVRQFALLNDWARKPDQSYRSLGAGHFDDAMNFHTTGGAGNTSLEGWLVRLLDSDDVALVGGPHSYASTKGNPDGLDFRTYVQGGQPVNSADIDHSTTQEQDPNGLWQTWYMQTWEFPANWISDDHIVNIGLHKVASCGNDQIGMVTTAIFPVPDAAVLGIIGLGIAGLVGKMRQRVCRA